MNKNEDILRRASRVLEDFEVVEHFLKLIDGDTRYESTSSVIYKSDGQMVEEAHPDDSNEAFSECWDEWQASALASLGLQAPNLENWVLVRHDGHDLVAGLSDFRAGHATRSATDYGEAYIYFDKVLVLHTGATKRFGEYGDTISVSIYPTSLQSFKAGAWLELLRDCTNELDADYKRRLGDKSDAKLAEQASKIDLGDYE